MYCYRRLLFLFLLPVASFGGHNIDSLAHMLNKHPQQDSTRIKLLNALGFEYWIVDSRKSLFYGNEAQKLSQKLKYRKGEAMAARVLGVAYWTQGEFKPALKNLTNAREIYSSLKDEEGLADCLLNTGMIYADISDYNTALGLYHKAITIFNSLKLYGRIATAYTKIGTVMLDKGQRYDAQHYLSNALKIHSQANFIYGMAEAHNRLGRLYLDENNIEQAEYHLRQAVVLGKRSGDEDGLISNMILFGRLLRIQGNYEASQAHLEFALQNSVVKRLIKYKLAALNELRQLKRVQGEDKSALLLFEEYLALKDSVFNLDKTRFAIAQNFITELEQRERMLQTAQREKKAEAMVKWVLVIAFSLITILGLLLLYSIRQKYKTQKDLLLFTRREAESSLLGQQEKQKELEEELHFKNKELTAYALNFVQKNELLQQLEEQLAAIRNLPLQRQQDALSGIEAIVRRHKNLEKDWEDFRSFFEQVHNQFLNTLKIMYPQLSGNDMKVAALARLNLTVKESANILGISPDSAKMARYRLRKKLGLEPEADLLHFLTELEKQQV